MDLVDDRHDHVIDGLVFCLLGLPRRRPCAVQNEFANTSTDRVGGDDHAAVGLAFEVGAFDDQQTHAFELAVFVRRDDGADDGAEQHG